MAVRPGPWKQMWINFKKTAFYYRRRVVFIGEDHFGNKYFEKPLDDISRNERLVIRKDKDQWNPPDLPTEWFAWLQYKRSEPPTLEEIEKNHVAMMKVKLRAEELRLKEKQLLTSENSTSLTSTSVNQEDDLTTLAKSQWANPTSFPLRTDLELNPGDFRTKDQEFEEKNR